MMDLGLEFGRNTELDHQLRFYPPRASEFGRRGRPEKQNRAGLSVVISGGTTLLRLIFRCTVPMIDLQKRISRAVDRPNWRYRAAGCAAGVLARALPTLSLRRDRTAILLSAQDIG